MNAHNFPADGFIVPEAIAAQPGTTGATPAIVLDGVGKVFAPRGPQAAVRAVDAVSLTVGKASITGIIGRSGAGKSTLIRLLNGLERPSEGRIAIEGRDVTGFDEARWRDLRRSIGMIFQHFNLLSSRTVAGNVALPLEIAGEPAATRARRVAELLDLVGLADKATRYPAELSGGQKQRVGIARALATRPGLLLCDEATSALDPETTGSILDLLATVNRTLGVTIVLVTHEIPVIRDICDTVVVMENGRVIESGSVFDVFTRPAHATTRSFVAGVSGVDVPETLLQRLRPAPQPGDAAVLRIAFAGEHATAPVVSRLGTLIGIDVNILAGRIGEIAGRPFGALVVTVPAREPALSAALAALGSLHLDVEVLGYVA